MIVSRRSLLKGLAVFTAATPLAACSTTGDGWFNPQASVDAANLSPSAAGAVASDIVAKLAEKVGPGTGTILLNSDKSQFGVALDAALHNWGYAVAAADQKPSGDKIIPLAYTINSDGSQILVRITTPSVELSRTYTATAEGADPSSPVAILTRAA
jgi:type IV secretion system protein TrbH